MNKLERIDAVLEGREPDRIPICVWYHFGHQHGSGEKFAGLVLEWFRHYDLDLLKLMNDYFYPMPAGLEEIRDAAGLAKLQRFDPEESDWREQLAAIRIIARELNGEAYFIDTVFDPWQSLQRSIAGEHLVELVKRCPNELKAALDRVADNLIEYSRRSIALGSSGIFMSLLGSLNQLERSVFVDFAKPAAMKVFRAVEALAPMNIAHLHGESIYLEEVLDFPVSILSWEDRAPGNPSIAEMRRRWKGVVMAGIDHNRAAQVSTAFARENVRTGLRHGGRSRFILANGCSLPSWIDPHALKAMIETAQRGLDR